MLDLELATARLMRSRETWPPATAPFGDLARHASLTCDAALEVLALLPYAQEEARRRALDVLEAALAVPVVSAWVDPPLADLVARAKAAR